MKKKTTKGTSPPSSISPAPAQAVESPGGWPRDEYTGHAGRYVRDPVTGLRRPAEDPATEQQPPAAAKAITPQPEGNTP